VTVENIQEWVPSLDLQGLNLNQARNIVANYFCGTIMTRGACPENCPVCQDEIVDLFRLKEAKQPAALLTWLAKDHAARWIEKLIERQKAGLRPEDFPALESPSAPLSEQEAFDRLFPNRRGEVNLFADLEREYETD